MLVNIQIQLVRSPTCYNYIGLTNNFLLFHCRRPARKAPPPHADLLPPPPVKKIPPPPKTAPMKKPTKSKNKEPLPKERLAKDAAKKQPPPKVPKRQHTNLISSIGKIVEKNRQFFHDRRGNAVAQSTAVLIPYVLSLL